MVQEDLLLFSLSFGLLVEQKQEVEDLWELVIDCFFCFFFSTNFIHFTV